MISAALHDTSAFQGPFPFLLPNLKLKQEQEKPKTMGQQDNNLVVTWQPKVAKTVREQLKIHEEETKGFPFNVALMVSLVGVPGSGKSAVCDILNDLLDDVGCMVMPFDGCCYPLDDLKQFPNADDYICRRGAPDTFDAARLKRDLARIRHTDEPTVSLPGFCHSRGHPDHDAFTYNRKHNEVVLCEGLCLLHDDHGFERTKEFFDLSICAHADVDDCVERLKVRNQCLPGLTAEEVEVRCEEVDRVNAMTVEQSKRNADIVAEAMPLCV